MDKKAIYCSTLDCTIGRLWRFVWKYQVHWTFYFLNSKIKKCIFFVWSAKMEGRGIGKNPLNWPKTFCRHSLKLNSKISFKSISKHPPAPPPIYFQLSTLFKLSFQKCLIFKSTLKWKLKSKLVLI